MIGPMPDYMKTAEWDFYKGDKNPFELKEGAPEWLKKAVEEDLKPVKQETKENEA